MLKISNGNGNGNEKKLFPQDSMQVR